VIIISGKKAFQLVDTYGMPFDMLQELCRERDCAVNWSEFCYFGINAGWPLSKLRGYVENNDVELHQEAASQLINTITKIAKYVNSNQ